MSKIIILHVQLKKKKTCRSVQSVTKLMFFTLKLRLKKQFRFLHSVGKCWENLPSINDIFESSRHRCKQCPGSIVFVQITLSLPYAMASMLTSGTDRKKKSYALTDSVNNLICSTSFQSINPYPVLAVWYFPSCSAQKNQANRIWCLLIGFLPRK